MPATAFFGKDGTVLSVGGVDMLGTFETMSASPENTVVEHNGPQDEVHYSTAVRTKLNLEIGGFVPATGGADALDIVKAKTVVAVSCDLLDGRTLSGDFTPVSASVETQTEPSKYRLSLESFGDWTIT